MIQSKKLFLPILVITWSLIIFLLSGCAGQDASLVSAPEELSLAYEVRYAGESSQVMMRVTGGETIDGIDCYVIEGSAQGSPQRLRLQGRINVSIEPMAETYWRSRKSLVPVRTISSVKAFKSMQVDTFRNFTYTGFKEEPYTVGSTWTYDVFVTPSMGKKSTVSWSSAVVGTEEITVPAGTFKCYVIEHTKTAVDGLPVENRKPGLTEWWSVNELFPGPVKIVDHSTYAETETRELQVFTRAAVPEDTPATAVPSDSQRLITGQAWADFCDSLKAAGDTVMDPALSVTEQDMAEGYRHLLRLLWVALNELVENDDPLRPYFSRYPNVPTRIGHDNPDNVYSGGPVRGDQTYLVTGNIGTNIFTSFNVYSGFIGFDPYMDLRTISSLNSEEMEINPDGTFEIILSAEPHQGNWLKLEPDAKILVVRKLFHDWENETEGSLQISNLGALGSSSDPLDPAEMTRKLDDSARFVTSLAEFFRGSHYAKFTSGDIPVNTIPPPQVGEMAMADPYNRTQWGHFKLKEGEALLVEFPFTECLYTNFQLGNMWWESLDYRTRQSHLNGFMSYLNDDGTYRYVICPEDPGVPNWLDTEGHLEGTMYLRWTYCKEAPETIVTRVVSFDKIWEYMPEDTPRITPRERAESIARRQEVVNRRYRP